MKVMIRATYSRSTSRKQKNFKPELIDAVYAEVPDGLVREKYCEALVFSAPIELQEDLLAAMKAMRKDGMFDY